MKRRILRFEAAENSGLVSTFRTTIKMHHNRAMLNGHLTDGRKSIPSLGDSWRLQAGRVERDGFCIQS